MNDNLLNVNLIHHLQSNRSKVNTCEWDDKPQTNKQTNKYPISQVQNGRSQSVVSVG